MTWHFTDSVDVYSHHAWGLLASRPAHNSIALSAIVTTRAHPSGPHRPDGTDHPAEAALFGWYEVGDEVLGAVSHTPPYEWLLAEVPPAAVDALVTALRGSGIDVPAVIGPVDTIDAFVTAWADGDTVDATTICRQRLYRLAQLRPPRPLPPGRARTAHSDDISLILDWWSRFQVEAHLHVLDADPLVRERTASGLLWLWEDAAGEPVSLAGGTPTIAGVARVGPVYTPPPQRRVGYAAAVTAACSQDALDRGTAEVVLVTDLANPTSNSIYQQLGYVPVGDRKIVRFTETPQPTPRADPR